jgi:hypothetical protein
LLLFNLFVGFFIPFLGFISFYTVGFFASFASPRFLSFAGKKNNAHVKNVCERLLPIDVKDTSRLHKHAIIKKYPYTLYPHKELRAKLFLLDPNVVPAHCKLILKLSLRNVN